jgi:uncharacterized membrane protein YeaQ/YmgE (transglycosylase-associated protein family)
MGVILWLVFGALSGWLATVLIGEDSRYGWVGNIVIGIVGALLGGWVSQALGGPVVGGFNFVSLLIAVAGSVLLLLIVNALRGNRRI